MNNEKKYGVDESYYTLLKLIGALCISLPLVVILGGFIQNSFIVQSSLSAYYYTNMRDYFVGFLVGVGLFLITVKGYEKIDDIMANISGICLIGVAIFPSTTFGAEVVKVGIFQINDNISGIIHNILACTCFVSLAFICLFLFTRHGDEALSKEKTIRNTIYIICGIVMILGMVFDILSHAIFTKKVLESLKHTLLTETILLFAFGIAWLVKGKTIFKDKDIEVESKTSGLHA
jgi:hypothetical protein